MTKAKKPSNIYFRAEGNPGVHGSVFAFRYKGRRTIGLHGSLMSTAEIDKCIDWLQDARAWMEGETAHLSPTQGKSQENVE